MTTFEWPIEDIIAAHPDLYLEHCAAMAVALMQSGQQSHCDFFVECDGFEFPDLRGKNCFRLRVAWSESMASKATKVTLTEQANPIVERAAVAIAALCFAHLIPHSKMRTTRHGEHADFLAAQTAKGIRDKRNSPAARNGTSRTRESRAGPEQSITMGWVCFCLLFCRKTADDPLVLSHSRGHGR